MIPSKKGKKKSGNPFGAAGLFNTNKTTVNPDHENNFDTLADDILKGDEKGGDDGSDSDSDIETSKAKRDRKKRGEAEEEEGDKAPPFMLFDFRKGGEHWPKNCELIDPKRFDELLEKATQAAEAAAKSSKKKDGEEGDEDKEKDKKKDKDWENWGSDETEKEEKRDFLHPEAVFETLKDGSTALVLQAGYRLKLSLSDIFEGGDATREARLKKEAKEKKRAAKYASEWGGWGGWGGGAVGPDPWDSYGGKSKWKTKRYLNEYTITMDIKLLEEPPREGISLYQTALIHVKENKRSGKSDISRSDGECLINQAGGVGILGTYGDSTKARMKAGQWKRVVISVRCADDPNAKGELRTWVGTEAGAILKEDAFAANDRFAIDPSSFYAFSSAQAAMMPGKIAIRTIRIENKALSHDEVKANRARDKLLSKFDEDRKKEAEEQRKGFSLAPLFPKPRPMWMAPAFSAIFGDAFIERTTLEASSNLAWSYEVVNFSLQQMLRHNFVRNDTFKWSHASRVALSDTLHIMQQSALVFKLMLKLLKTPSESQLLNFLRRVKKVIQGLGVGETLLFPVLVEGTELMLVLERSNDRFFKMVVIQTDPYNGLSFHAVNIVDQQIKFRTAMVLNSIPKKNILDDVFWMAVYNMAIHTHIGDVKRFYDILLPFLTGHPLEASLVDAENAALKDPEHPNLYGEFRMPQRSYTAYVKCILESFNYLLRRRGVSTLEIDQVHLTFCSELVKMMQNDLRFMLPSSNGVRICDLAIKELSYQAVRLVDGMKAEESKDVDDATSPATMILNEIHKQIEEATEAVNICKLNETELPPPVDLRGPQTDSATDPALMQFRNMLAWDAPPNDPDPGQQVALQKYVPVDLLQIPQKATTQRDAIEAIRRTERLCTLLDNQKHCIKNDKFIIASVIEHVFTQVIPVPKARGVGLTEEELHRSGHSKRRDEKREEERKKKEEEKKKRKEEALSKAGKDVKKKGKNNKDEEEEEKKDTWEGYGDKLEEDFTIGKEYEEEIVNLDCIWDEPVTYELQVELLLSLQRVTEHFAAAVLSIQQSRPFDAVIIIVHGCLAAIADAIMRKVAIDEPSEACTHLMGRTARNRQLGYAGFGISVGSFATQCETLEVHTPELAIAKTAVLDYFQSPQQRRLEKIFTWEEHYSLRPNKPLIKYLRMIAKEIALPVQRPFQWLLDGNPITSDLMKSYPELKCYRDIAFWWKYFLNPDIKVFRNYLNRDNPQEIPRLPRMECQLSFGWHEEERGYQVTAFRCELRCRPDPKQVDALTGKPIPPESLPIHRFLSTATPSFYVPPPAIKSEDDVIYRPNLPGFDDEAGQVLNQRDSELLISYMTVPYLRVPLILSFFSSDDRIHKLQSEELRKILDSVLFEPGKYLRMDMCKVEPRMVPSTNAELLATPYGMLLNEFVRSPETVIRSILTLLRGALACDTGSVVDEKSDKFNISTTIILYATRLGARVDNYLSFLVDYNLRIHDCIDWPLRDSDVNAETLQKLKEGLDAVREILHTQFAPLLEDYLKRLDLETSKDPTNETLIDRNSRLACDLHSHKLLMYRNYHDFQYTPDIAKTLLGSFVYLTTRHTWNKSTVEGARLQMPETQIYELLQVNRRRLITWLGQCRQGILDEVMQTVLQVSSSLTGSFKASAAILDDQNRWSRIQGERSCGRWAVGSTRTTVGDTNDKKSGDSSDDLLAASPPMRLQRQHSHDNQVGEVEDNGMLGVEIDVQLGQMTLRSKHLSALIPDVANHPDVNLIFGDATIQASLIATAENCDKFRLVGLNHEIEYWKSPHTVCPPLGEEWDREYDPAELADSERWIANLFEPIRKNFFDGPAPPPMQFMMTAKATPEDAEVAVMVGLHQKLGGPYKLVYLFRRLKCIHIYECVSQGRQWWFTLHLTTDYRYALRELEPSTAPRSVQFPDWWIRAGGNAYPAGFQDVLLNDVEAGSRQPSLSVLIHRDQQHKLNLSGGRETLVPSRLLYGVVPETLLDNYLFWQDESIAPAGTRVDDLPLVSRGYKRLRGYPREEDGEFMIIVEFLTTGDWSDLLTSTSESKSSKIIQCTGFPGRTVKITRRPMELVKAEFKARQRIASHIESLKLLTIPKLSRKKKKDDKAKEEADEKDTNKFELDEEVEADHEGNGNEYWPCVIRRVNDNGTYDVEYMGEYKWVGTQKNMTIDFIQKRGENERKKRGEGVWHWDGMSEDEEDDWRSSSEDGQEDDDEDEEEVTIKKDRLPFHQFDQLSQVLEAGKYDIDACLIALSEVAMAPSTKAFTEVSELSRAVASTLECLVNMLDDDAEKIKPADSEDMIMLNLLYAPRSSRLYSVLKVLARIENAGYICAWTKAKNCKAQDFPTTLEYGCPPIDLIELPSLKLSFTGKYDHAGEYRLFSVDHVDLYISNERNPTYEKLLAGIPHSIIMSNVRGETQILVPVIPPVRVRIGNEPFSTFIVLQRAELENLAERFFLYPIHVSFSFLLTKGVNSALYLMLLRLLHRDYSEVFRLSDSIATDTQFNKEGLIIYKRFTGANDDWHPDAHACRLKISLVTIDSGMELPWDLTIECARYIVKLDSVSSFCRISPREELQILESDFIVTSTTHAKYNKEIHDEYSMALCYNRLQYLKKVVRNYDPSRAIDVPCIFPARSVTRNWPYYQDNTIFGEQYLGLKEVVSQEGSDGSWQYESVGGDEQDAPSNGWLVVAVFHTLWSTDCINIMPAVEEMIPIYQDVVNFVSVKADRQGMKEISKKMKINSFPTFLVLRGGKEVDRIEGSERVIERVIRAINLNVTQDDKMSRAKHRHRIRLEKALEMGKPFVEEEIEEKVGLDWTFDPEQCGENMKIEMDGMCAILQEDENSEEDVTWEYTMDNNRNWKPFSKEVQKQIESEYRAGKLYNSCYCSTKEGDFYLGSIKITDYEVSGFYGTHYPDYNSMNVRRWGDRLSVPNEEPYVSKEQKERDKRSVEWREKLAAHRKKMKDERIGKDIECIRGTVGFLANTGVHRWSMRWNHEPSRFGTSDCFGICSELREEFGAGRAPNLGANDAGASIGIVADGSIYHNGNILQQIEGTRKRTEVEVVVEEKPVESSETAAVANETPTIEATEAAASSEEKATEEVTTEPNAVATDGEMAVPSAEAGILEVPAVVEEKKEELPSIETPVLAPLFGRKSVIVCEFDTTEGGTFRFFIDGEKIGEDITGVYEKLGGAEIFPCLCISPLDPALIESRKLVQGKKMEKINEVKRKQEEQMANGEPPSTEDPAKLASLGINEEELFDLYPSVFLNLDMDAVEQEIKEKKEGGKPKPPTDANVPLPPSAMVAAAPSPFGFIPAADSSNIFQSGFGDQSTINNLLATGLPMATDATAAVEGATAEAIDAPAADGENTASAETKTADADKPDNSISKVRWMYFSGNSGWNLYSVDASRELEEAARDNKSSYILNVGAAVHRVKIDRMVVSVDDGESDMRLRKQVVAEGLQGMWELMATKFEKPHGLSGAGLLKVFERIWGSQESLKGESCGLGFIFLYNLLSGETRAKVVSSGYSGYSGYEGYGNSGGGGGGYYKFGGKTTGGSTNDAHRLATLIAQLYSDRQIKSIAGSVVNVLARNRQVSLRMPKFKDNRRAQSPFFMGWIDDNEVSSPLADLFSKLAPMMQTLRRKGTFHFPPGPPHPEMSAPPKTITIPARKDVSPAVVSVDTPFVYTERLIPEISDYGCEERVVAPVSVHSVAELVAATKFRMKNETISVQPPMAVEDTKHFQDIVKQNPGKLIVLNFYGSWCGPCKAFAPAYHLIALKSPTMLFLKADVDECDQLAAMFKVETVPTIFYLRGGAALNNVLTKIQGGIPFIEQLEANVQKFSTTEEKFIMKDFFSGAPTEVKSVGISADDNEVTTLANQPLLGCNEFIVNHQRTALGLDAVNPSLAFDVRPHESAQSAPARAVLNRFRDDVAAFSDFANQSPVVRITHLADNDVRKYFAGEKSVSGTISDALRSVQKLLKRLNSIKDADYRMIQDTIPLLEHAVNYVDTTVGDAKEKQERVRYLLYRKAGQNSLIWTEFLFGVLISTKGEEDLRKLNPFLSKEAIQSIMNLTSLTMLRANRLGHTNRCIGTTINLEKMLESILKLSETDRVVKGEVMIPKLLQLTDDLAKTITMGRYYMTEVPSKVGNFTFDPRYLVFEFVWNIQLRLKQVEIVNDFRQSIKDGRSKVKQMIMGAGKTSVVAPLLALIVADGKSLVLSVVPKALVEMSRTRMRETFAAIMVKRIYTLDFERSTVVKPSMSKSLENAAINRGVVVCTPTTLKSVMLSYVEVLQRLKEANANGLKTKLAEYKTQAQELAKILELFRTGVMLLDEVDLILHPLKSELNFPIGEKFDLDGSEEGERWNLPVHLFDAFLYFSTGRVSSFEQRGVALDILKQISAVIQKGIAERNLQRLPHIILLNNEFYHKELKPIMAEWTFLWLQKQHLHGIDHQEAIQYLLEGAAAKSDASTKIHLLEQAMHKVKMTMGDEAPMVAPTRAHLRTMSAEKRQELDHAMTELKRQASDSVAADSHLHRLLDAEEKYLEKILHMANTHRSLVNEIYDVDEQIDSLAKTSGRHVGELQSQIIALQKKINDIECPRDDSLDNSVVLWCSQAFAAGEVGGQSNTGESSVPSICNIIEDMGYTVRRAADVDEAVVKARELQEEGQLRCLIIGGDETGAGCGPGCTKLHLDKCLKCGRDAFSHQGHECPTGGRGSWVIKEGTQSSSGKNMEIIAKLTDAESAYAMTHKTLPPTRIAVYSAHVTLTEPERMKYWKNDTSVFDASKQLVSWVQSHPSWVNEEEEEVVLSKTDQAEKAAQEKIELAKMKVELEQLEAQRISTGDSDEQRRRSLHAKAAEKHAELTESVQAAIGELVVAQKEFEAFISMFDNSLIGTLKADNIGPQNGRDAAMALAWIDTHRATENVTNSTENRSLIIKHYVNVLNELSFLRQMELAAKVVAHVTSPHHKKLLNLSHNWLRTFLPHCLAKVNRVSFGLLSVEDCNAALEADPFVPRSRLKLAVPFVGKDVPSKSSEFAHPDIIIGLTILAYRYSGLRRDDYIDIIDRLTAQFSNEIGPARDRESSLRHEKWVYASGGAIRGLKATRDGLPWQKHENLSEEELNNKEVVQLKFLQKSNKEQMDKLFELIKLEPLVVHHYLQSMIFPLYMRSQREKISASGQAVGGDMLVGKRVGFSGTPSDLLPQELGRCDYETGDDGMMINTCLDRSVASYEFIDDKWTVEMLLERIATSESPRYHALIDTGALITGYSNEEVAKQLLDRGLSWCDGVVFLDDDDKQQVLVRATGRVVSAEQCGVSLEKRFAFYDQIHTTGMDIKHVVNATACVTLGKDMVFRDFVQGAYRMRGIGNGQKIRVFIIPEVKELMQRELKDAIIPVPGRDEIAHDHVLEDVVAWLIINSLRSEQTQWTMLCIQNIGNLYRKNAFKALRKSTRAFVENKLKEADIKIADDTTTVTETVTSVGSESCAATEDDKDAPQKENTPSSDWKKDEDEEEQAQLCKEGPDAFIDSLDKEKALTLFTEDIDFSLESGVPDPVPFEDKLRSMLDDHETFLLPDQHEIGHSIMEIVGQFSMVEGSANRLDTEQEREQEQEQEKEVEQRRDQQVEIEKFVEREYSRQEETQRPWPFRILSQKLTEEDSEEHPFYHLNNFQLKHHEPLNFPGHLFASCNYFNLKWTGLRRVKNVVMLLEYAPSTDAVDLRLKRADEHNVQLTEAQNSALLKAHTLLGFYAKAHGQQNALARDDVKNAILALTDAPPTDEVLDEVMKTFASLTSSSGQFLSLSDFTKLMVTGFLTPESVGRHWVAVSLAEAETIRRVLHVRSNKSNQVIPNASTELALHYSPMCAPKAPEGGDGGVIFDASVNWHKQGTKATWYEASSAHNNFRFFDCDMYYSNASLNVLLKTLGGSVKDKESFFLSMIGVRRRMERKWQETPIAKVFTVPDQFTALRHQALAMFIVESLKVRNMTIWEAFTAFDNDNNGLLSPAEFYGALLWLSVPDLTAEDVVDYFEVADKNRDGQIDYREYVDFLTLPGSKPADLHAHGDEEDMDTTSEEDETKDVHMKVEPHGAEELREIILRRKQQEQIRQREERIKKQAYKDALDIKIFEEELEASRRRKGGQNPLVAAIPRTVFVCNAEEAQQYAARHHEEMLTNHAEHPEHPSITSWTVTDFKFFTNQHPLRFVAVGKNSFIPIFFGTPADKPVSKLRCRKQHELYDCNYYWMNCTKCTKRSTDYVCWNCSEFICKSCFDGHRRVQEMERRDPEKNPTFLRCQPSCSFTLQVPMRGGADRETGDFSFTMEVRMQKLPPSGQLQSLLRFSLPDLAQSKRVHRTSVYLNSEGVVVGRPLEKGGLFEFPEGEESEAEEESEDEAEEEKEENEEDEAEEEENEEEEDEKEEAEQEGKEESAEEGKEPAAEGADGAEGDAINKDKKKKIKEARVGRVYPGKWCVITIVVQPALGRLVSYVDGKICHISEDLDPADLRLQHKVVVLGGGKQAHVRGGDVRRVVIHSAVMDDMDVKRMYYALSHENPAVGGLVTKLQALVRGFLVRCNDETNLGKMSRALRGEEDDDDEDGDEEDYEDEEEEEEEDDDEEN